MAVWLAACAAVVGQVRKRRQTGEGQVLFGMGLWVLAAWSLLHMAVLGVARYHYPVIPFLVMYAAVYVESLRGRRKAQPC